MLKRQMENLLALYSFFRKSKRAKTKSRGQSKMLEKKCLFNHVNLKKNTERRKGEKKLFVQKFKFCCRLKKEVLRIF